VKIKSRIKDYSVEMIDDIFSLSQSIKINNTRFFFIIDEKLYSIYKCRMDKFVGKSKKILIPAKEESKTLPYIMNIYRKLFDNGFNRNDTLFTFGGGILQDISGFIASTIYRGVRWIFAPTTLLAQADSCIGSKTSINFYKWKNQIGTFYPPDKIFIDPNFTDTLTDRDFYSGLGEIIKVHLMGDEGSFDSLSKYLCTKKLHAKSDFTQMVSNSLKIKRSYFEGDEFDTGRRNLLNYGHCFGHALESASNFEINHGEAVLLGIGFSNQVALNRKILCKTEFLKIESVIKPYYPVFDLKSISIKQIINNMKHDKKRTDKKLVMIVLKKVGVLEKRTDIEEQEIEQIYSKFVEYIHE
jgi:3-dehydroquinate synthase